MESAIFWTSMSAKPIFRIVVRFKQDEHSPCRSVPETMWQTVRGTRVTLIRPEMPTDMSAVSDLCDSDTHWLAIKSPEILELFARYHADPFSRNIVLCRHVLDIGD